MAMILFNPPPPPSEQSFQVGNCPGKNQAKWHTAAEKEPWLWSRVTYHRSHCVAVAPTGRTMRLKIITLSFVCVMWCR